MREIKFRAWDNISKSMSYPGDGSTYCVTALGVACVDETDDGGILENRAYRTELMQYTGLRDKNGNKIYEGDIIQDPDIGSDSNCLIKYEEGAFYANAVLAPEDGSNDLASEYAPAAVVIGNIHEHPELLKEAA